MLLSRALDRAGQARRYGDRDPFAIPSPGDVGATSAGAPVNDRTAMRLTSVFACASLLSEVPATLPIGAYERRGTERRPVTGVRLFDAPHPEYDWVDWAATELLSLVLKGDALALVGDIDRDGNPAALMPLDKDAVSARRDSTGRIRYRVHGHSRRYDDELAWPLGPIWHVRGLRFPGQLMGCSPIEYCRQTVGLALAAEEYGARFFGDGAIPTTVLETTEKIRDEAVAKRILRSFVDGVGGRGRRKPVLLEAGTTAKAISIAPNEAQFLETRQFGVTEIARLFRVPPHLIADTEKSTSWGTGIEQQGIAFVTYTLGPWIRRLELGLTRLLPAGQLARVNVAGLLRGDLQSRYAAYALGRQWGWLSVNDILALEDRPAIDGGDVYLSPLNMVAAGTQVTRAQREAVRAYLDDLDAADLAAAAHGGDPAPTSSDTRDALRAEMEQLLDA